jgi:transposase
VVALGDSFEKIADNLKVSGECIRGWIHAFLARGIASLRRQSSSERPKILETSEQQDGHILFSDEAYFSYTAQQDTLGLLSEGSR